MVRFLALASLLLLLGACQAQQTPRDFDTSRDFTTYRTWSWAQPAVTYRPDDDPRIQSDLMTQRIQEAVSGQLDARGLRPAQGDARGDLLVRVYMVVDERQDTVTTHYGGVGYWGRWGGPMMAQTRPVYYQVATLQIDLLDAQDRQLVWRGSTSEMLGEGRSSPAERQQTTYDMVRKVLSGYPPY